MPVVDELIRTEENEALSFGNHLLGKKGKIADFKAFGHSYEVKSFEELTRLHKDDALVFEAVPGVSVFSFKMNEQGAAFEVSGLNDTQITVELEPSTEYKVYIDKTLVDKVKSNAAGKINFSLEAVEKVKKVKIEKL